MLLLLHHPVPLVLLHPCSKGVIFILASILLFVIAYISEIIKGGIHFPALAHLPLYHISHHTDTNIRHLFRLKIADSDFSPAEDCNVARCR